MITVKFDPQPVLRMLDDIQRRQLPFATAKALTQTAKAVQTKLTAEIERAFDRPTPFTKKAIGIKAARKDTLTAEVFVRDIQAKYLKLQIEGGTRRPIKRALLLPANVALNQYGNMPRNLVKRLRGRKDVFSATINGTPGLWQRVGRSVRLLVGYEPQAQYQRRFDFYGIGQREAERRLPANFARALADALRTAR